MAFQHSDANLVALDSLVLVEEGGNPISFKTRKFSTLLVCINISPKFP